MYETILIPTDGSDHARQAAERGFDLASTYDAAVQIVHVIEDPDSGVTVHEYDEGVRDDMERTGEGYVDDLVSTAEGRDVAATGEVRHGAAHEEIIGAADDHAADLIVMATHGRTGLEGLVLGSTAERVVRLASVSVLVARPDDESPPNGE
ncbi:universal stress protein [Halococcus salifodinae]|uniref:Putative universal stress protein n=1 Tax=Halococcus salifodinae DSM 8989 TaxID=1227456 RepID=M0MX23_9EURY|nr:universal stress protein [Halococcus salifodinae]EMA49873.1 putative universal stress protein [Halococcus salifodinae DSM 8989]